MNNTESLTPFDRYVIFATAMRNISKIIEGIIDGMGEEANKTSEASTLLMYQFQGKILEILLQFMLDILTPDFQSLEDDEDWEEEYDEDYT